MRFGRPAWRWTCLSQPSLVRHNSYARQPFTENDVVILRHKSDPSAPPILSKPLAAAAKIQTHKGALNHSDIIGKLPRDIVTSSSGSDFRIHNVSLSEYVCLSKRLVTPIYPADANLIASLFDIHVSPPASTASLSDQPKLEILEAGTGHGSLTLHLSRAIHAANTNPPQSAIPSSDKSELEGTQPEPSALDVWKEARRAVLHTIDVSPKYSKHARKVVQGFQRGLYANNVDFHVGDVSEWVKSESQRRSRLQRNTEGNTASTEEDQSTPAEPFLSHAFLDLPGTNRHLATVASALHIDGVLVIFNPSITQITDCVLKIKQDRIPLYLDQVLELGNNGSSGGREWDVRAVKPRARAKIESRVPEQSPTQLKDEKDIADVINAGAEQHIDDDTVADSDWSLVCRPKAGERIGGGFLGVFRKMKDQNGQDGDGR